METQVLKEKPELMFETRWMTTTVTVKEFTPAGVKMEYNLVGETSGRMTGHTFATVYAVIKPDRSSEYEARAVTTTTDGEAVLGTAKGKGRADGSISRSETEDAWVTSAPKLSWLNTTKTRSEVAYNRLTGEGTSKAYKK